MASPTTNKGYTYPAHGGGVGTWDTNLNGNFEYQDLNLGGYYPITLSSTTVTTFSSGSVSVPSSATSITFSASLAQNLFYNITGPSSQNLTVNMPAAGSIYVFANNSSGTATMSVGPTGGSAVTLTQGGQTVVVMTSTGANFAQNVFRDIAAQAITAVSVTTSSGITTTGPITQNSSQYEQLPSGPTAARPGAPVAGYFRYNSTLAAIEYWNGTLWAGPAVSPTVQIKTSGTAQTYTPTSAGITRWRIRMVGGGGGGGGNSGAGTAGTDTTFQVNSSGTAWTATKGGAGASGNGVGGIGGASAANGSTGTKICGFDGADGGFGNNNNNGGDGAGGNSVFGGGGNSVRNTNAGSAAKANTGSGGSGGNNAGVCGAGGGAGAYVEFWVTGMTTATYTVGAAGAGGTGTATGGAGAAGIIIIEEFYD